jgi:hypothetical protein
MVQSLDKAFEVPVSKVRSQAVSMGKSPKIGGIFWTKHGKVYKGMSLPAHYNERGTITPTKKPVNINDYKRKKE